jgi:hypothetical protein
VPPYTGPEVAQNDAPMSGNPESANAHISASSCFTGSSLAIFNILTPSRNLTVHGEPTCLTREIRA